MRHQTALVEKSIFWPFFRGDGGGWGREVDVVRFSLNLWRWKVTQSYMTHSTIALIHLSLHTNGHISKSMVTQNAPALGQYQKYSILPKICHFAPQFRKSAWFCHRKRPENRKTTHLSRRLKCWGDIKIIACFRTPISRNSLGHFPRLAGPFWSPFSSLFSSLL